MAIVAVTFLFGAGQFTLFAYFTPYFRDVLHASTNQSSLLLVWFGIFGVIGNLALTRFIDRIGAHAAVTAMVCLMALSFLIWPFASGVIGIGLAVIPWALRLLLLELGAAGPAQRRGAGARLGPARPQHLGDLPRPGRRRVERRLADRARAATPRSAGSAWPG